MHKWDKRCAKDAQNASNNHKVGRTCIRTPNSPNSAPNHVNSIVLSTRVLFNKLGRHVSSPNSAPKGIPKV